MKKLLVIVILFGIHNLLFAQETEPDELITITGDTLAGSLVNEENIREVIGNVVIIQGDVTITCDIAKQFLQRNEVELIGNVVCVQDTVTIKTAKGYYFGNNRIAKSDVGVLLDDGRMKLDAVHGYYYFNEQRAFFYEKVCLYDSINTLKSDTLNYYYDNNKAVAISNVEARDTSSVIYADSLVHFRDSLVTFGYHHVRIVDTTDSLIITGEYLEDFGQKDSTRITGDPILFSVDTDSTGRSDTLFIKSKELIALKDSLGSNFIALDSVKIIRGEFASVNERTYMFRNEDRIFTYKNEDDKIPPVLWYENSQLVGDTVNIFLVEDELDRIDITSNGTITSENKEYYFRYDQVSGNIIKIYFRGGDLNLTEIFGSVLSIYYTYDDGKPNGLIKSSSNNAKIFFEDKKVVDVRLYGSPSSEYHPENLVEGKEKDFTLPSFLIFNNRPIKEKMISEWNKR
ncbi:MAG: OstA-like protein [bacterium]